MRRLLSWIGKIVAAAYGGPLIVDVGDPGLDPVAADTSGPRWVYRVGVLTPLAVLLLFFIRVPWPLVAVVAAILLLPMVLNRILALRRL